MDAPPPYREKNGHINKGYEASLENLKTEDGTSSDEDPWALPDLEDTETPWNELSGRGKLWRVLWTIIRILLFIAFLYFFICSLTFLSDGFKLLGGKTAGQVFRNNEILQNPVAGVMIGVLATVLVQSSSTTTSIVVGMVSGGLLDVQTSIPIVMGANIGTSVTNTIVSLGQITNKNDFRRAFAGATVHDMFNWLTVIVLLPLEVLTGYLNWISGRIVASVTSSSVEDQEYLTKLTKPLTGLVIQLDSKGITQVAQGADIKTLMKDCCLKGTKTVNVSKIANETDYLNTTVISVTTWTTKNQSYCLQKCEYWFHDSGLSDVVVGVILLVASLVILCLCLFGIVKTLNSVLKGNIRKAIRRFVNYDFPGRFAYFTGYIAILIGTGLTFLVQSSSVFTSTLTPLVGVGVISLDRMYPLTLGSNIGTTTTSILAALAGDNIHDPLQVAMCHLFFNLSGIVLFYPIPFLRFPVSLAKFLGMETAKYRWFAVAYLVLMFFVFPAVVFGLSIAGWYVLVAVLVPIGLIIVVIGVIKTIQQKRPSWLPKKLQNFKFLPVYCRSLEPLDRNLCGLCCKCKSFTTEEVKTTEQNGKRRDNTRL